MTVFQERRGFCGTCEDNRLLKKPKYNVIFWMIASAFTFGIMLPFALLDAFIVKPLSKWKCSTCGECKDIKKKPQKKK